MADRPAARDVLPAVRRPLFPLVLALVLAASAAAGQSGATTAQPKPPPAGEEPPPVDVDRLPISVERVQQQLEREPAMKLIPSQPVFRVEVIELRPRWFDTEIDWTDGRAGLPVPTRPAWHDQFLSMVTPPEAQMYGAYTGTDLLQVMATSVVQALATTAIASRVRDAVRERRENEAKREVDEAISRWKRDREAGGTRDGAEPGRDDGNAAAPPNSADPPR